MSAEPLSVLIVDDEPPARERLERLIGDFDDFNVAGTANNGRDAIELAADLKPAVVLLDIRMPGISGLETARHLAALDEPPAVVFTTAYDQYALEAFDSQAVGYLLKPVRQERLLDALRHASRLAGPDLGRLGERQRPLGCRDHVAVRIRDRLKLIPLTDVIYFRAEQKYVTVRHRGGEDLIEESLKQLEDEFADRFVRIHRSLLISVAEIHSLQRCSDGGYQLKLRGLDEALPVSRRQVSDVKARLKGAPERRPMSTIAG